MLDFIKDIYTSFRRASLERVRSPVLGAFVFSWLGFNWQLILIIAKSKKTIEETIIEINKDFGIETLLIAPICTTALICILLPIINKYVTKLQDAPNSDTIIMNLSAKIKIAEYQQTIAETEAKIKLSEKKEERFIEEDIYKIKNENKKLNSDNNKNISLIETLEKDLSQSQLSLSRSEAKLEIEKKSAADLTKNIDLLKAENNNLNKDILGYMGDRVTLTQEINSIKAELHKKNDNLNHLRNRVTAYESEIHNLSIRYPDLFEARKVNDEMQIIHKTNVTTPIAR